MREAIGGTWLTTIVIFLVLLFSGYLAISINFSKAFNAKNEIVSIVTRKRGIYGDEYKGSIGEIISYLNSIGYRSVGSCPLSDDDTGWYGLRIGDDVFEPADSGNDYYLCAKRIPVTEPGTTNELVHSSYFRIKVFFHLDVPVLRNIFDFSVAGDTQILYYPGSFDYN